MADFGTVARPYARAVFQVALADGNLDGWSKALAAAAAIADDKTAHRYLSRPGLGADERSAFFADICTSMDGADVLASRAGKNLLKLLSENDRLSALGEIAVQFDQLKAEQENKVKVTLVSASEIDAAQAESISGALSRKLGRAVELELEVDASLLGGAVIRAKDMVIDDSLRTRLSRLAGTLVE